MAVFTALTSSLVAAGVSTFWASMAVGAIQVAAGIGISLIGKALAGEPDKAKFGTQIRLQGGDDVPRSIIFGLAATAGSEVYGNAWGTVNDVPNAFFTRVIALADYPITGVPRVFAKDSVLTFDDEAHPDRGFPALEYRKDGVDHFWVKIYDGNQTTADSFLVSQVSSVDRPYTSNRIGYGIPYAIITAMAPERNDGEETPLFSGGFPDLKFEVVGAKLYDISKDTTEGGDGSQRFNDKSTWGGDGDHLPMVQAYNILRGIKYEDLWLYGLQNISKMQIPSAVWIAAIEKCRAGIDGPDGIEPTYRTGGEIQVGAQIKYALEAILTGCQGTLSEIGGVYKPQVGEPGDAVKSFTDDDIIDTEPQSFTPFFGLEDSINGIQAKFPNPEEGWNIKTAPPLLDPVLEQRDGNRQLLADVTLDMVPYKGQVQRLMKSGLETAQRARRHTYTLGPEYWALEPGDIISWTSERNGYIDKLFKVDGVADQPELDVLVDMTEVDPSDYDWDQDEDYTPIVNAPTDIVNPVALETFIIVTAVAVKDENDEDRRPGVNVEYQSGLQSIIELKCQVRVFGQIEPFQTIPLPYGSPWNSNLPVDFSPLTKYQVRAIYVRENGEPSLWSDWEDVTTLDIKLGSGDIIVDGDSFADDFTAIEIVDTLPVSGNFEGRVVYLTTNGKLYRYHSSAWIVAVPAVDITGQITTVQIVDSAITTDKIAALAVTANEIAASTITGAKIAANTITAGNIVAGTITATELATNSVTSDKIVANAITTGKIDAGAIVSSHLTAGVINVGTLIADNIITTSKVVPEAITYVDYFSNDPTTLTDNFGSYTSMVDGTVSVPDGDTTVILQFTGLGYWNGNDAWPDFRIVKNGSTVIDTFIGNFIFNANGFTPKRFLTAYTFKDKPGVGTHTYDFQLRVLINVSSSYVQSAWTYKRLVTTVSKR